MKRKLGFIQGRMSPIVDGKIQAFPWSNWQHEFFDACENNFALIEWTLDYDRLYSNPIMTDHGQLEVLSLCDKYGIKIPSLTGDFIMQRPFYKQKYSEHKSELLMDFVSVVNACSKLKIGIIVFPLVDEGALKNCEEEVELLQLLKSVHKHLVAAGVKVAFESDYKPRLLHNFISKLPEDTYGINYDIGNSASLGHDPALEISTYADRILNVHIKDRTFGGGTVALGKGDAQFKTVFNELKKAGYGGNYILQTARSEGGYHKEALNKYRGMVLEWI
ncbi:MAG: sugar phosphate isomerase/epimerase [Coxiellaceae bacterium]|nr:sugar phosphate isomerase/epimerase [Coxiellaceae bacterium]